MHIKKTPCLTENTNAISHKNIGNSFYTFTKESVTNILNENPQ